MMNSGYRRRNTHVNKPRIVEWTQLRGLAFLAIVMQHNIAEYIYRADIEQPDSVMLTMIYHLTRFGTPTFVFLSGVMLFYHHSHTKPDYPVLSENGLEISMYPLWYGHSSIGCLSVYLLPSSGFPVCRTSGVLFENCFFPRRDIIYGL